MTIQIESVTIRSFRGIRGEERFEFGGENSIIVGPNGSGKSTVLQAIEFLLTGEISALTGSGTQGIRTTEHVPNQYSDPDDTAVQATFTTGTGETVRAVREFSDRTHLQASNRPEEFTELITAAEQGLVHLSRDELLELVIATDGNRKDQIYQLMNTGGLDGRRKQLKRLAKTAEKKAQEREARRGENLRQIRDVAGKSVVTNADDELELRPAAFLEAVNDRRERIDGDSIGNLNDIDSFQDGIVSPMEQASNPLQRDDVQRGLADLHDWLTSGSDDVEATVDELKTELRALHADEDSLSMLAEQSLVQQGLEIIDENTTVCPLCEEPWDADSLNSHLEERAEILSRADERRETIERLSADARTELETIRVTFDRVTDVLNGADLDIKYTLLTRYRDALETLVEVLAGDLTEDPRSINIDELSLPESNREQSLQTVTALRSATESLPDRSMIETTWSQLQTLDDAYGLLQAADKERMKYSRAADEFETLHETFLEARDDVLGETFETISERFAAFYEAVNPDESSFDPTISQTKTGVDFSVDFYETGEHPPHALHSEGHQDLMGVCLFLALSSELSPFDRHPVLLDDVVMSVDEEHRQQLATVLEDELSDHFQLFITTHDADWATQLADTGVARNENVVRFTDWAPDRGPTVRSGLQ